MKGMGQATHLAVYFSGNNSTFNFFVGARRAFGRRPESPRRQSQATPDRSVLVSLTRVPKPFREVMMLFSPAGQRKRLGDIAYSIKGDTAILISMYPKEKISPATFGHGVAPGLAGHLEKLAGKHLRSLGVRKVMEDSTSMRPRIRQVQRSGLPLKQRTIPVRLDKWMRGIARGSRRAVKAVAKARKSGVRS